MRVQLLFIVYFVLRCAFAAAQTANVDPEVMTLTVEEGTVAVVHLSPGYTTSVHLPEEVNSVVVGNPASFKAEHSENEPRLVFIKPVTSQAVASNALITTRSGQEINLHLVSEGRGASHSRVDFLVEYRRPRSALIGASLGSSFLVPETRPLPQNPIAAVPAQTEGAKAVDRELARQKEVATPAWQGNELQVAIGESIEQDHRTIVCFSVLNRSRTAIEVLPPQIELSSKRGSKQIKAEPVPILEYRLTSRRLGPGERADGVVVFERPSFKEADERLLLEVAEAAQVDHPVVLPLSFTPASAGGAQ
jgi:hypothetical protein